jgi:hypothetical protein
MNDRNLRVLLTAAFLMVTAFPMDADAQQGMRRFQCTGYVTGVLSQALLEITPGGLYTEGPGVAGRIGNQFTDYTFSGTLFGGTEGFVSLVELRTGARIDRVWIGVWIGLSQAGFALRTEDGAMYAFECRE